MKNSKTFFVTTLAFAIFLAACSPSLAPTALPTPGAIETVETAVATEPQPASLPFEAATYSDVERGIELQYPADWFVVGGETQTRGSYVQIVSWDPGTAGISEIPAGESVLQIAIYQWDPKHDLAARVEMRRNNFTASGNTILEEEALMLGSVSAVRMLVLNTDGSQSVFLFTELGEDYLELSGSGDIAKLDASMRTLTIGASQ